jgi:peptidyl-prolyl cis-trans isomerase C
MNIRYAAVLHASVLGLAVGVPAISWAQTAPPAATEKAPESATAGAPQGMPVDANPLLAKVGHQEIRMSDLQAALGSLPAEVRQMPPQQLYPMLLQRLVDESALAQEAERTGLAKDPKVAHEVELAKTIALGGAMLNQAVRPAVTEAAVKAAYDKQYAGKPGPEEVHAEHILVDNEATAKKIIAELKSGTSWDDLAKKYSKDKGAGANGDLGWFTKDQMVAPFADEAFKLKPGEVSPEPVHSQFGWHVIKVLGRRQAPAPTFEQAGPQIRQQLAQEAAEKAVKQALSQVKVVQYGLDGKPVKPAGGAPSDQK